MVLVPSTDTTYVVVLFDLSVPVGLTCQYHMTPAGGVPERVTVLLPHVLLLTVRVELGFGGAVPPPMSIGAIWQKASLARRRIIAGVRRSLIP